MDNTFQHHNSDFIAICVCIGYVLPEGVIVGFCVKGAFVVAGVCVGRGLGTVELCSHFTWTACLQHLQFGSNLNPVAQFLTTGSISVQRRKVLHSGSAGLGATDPDGQAFPEIGKHNSIFRVFLH